MLDGKGNLLICDDHDYSIWKVDLTNGTITTIAGNGPGGYGGDNGPATAASLYVPYDITMDTTGNLYIADQGNNCIRKVNTAGIISTIAGTRKSGYNGDNILATSAQLASPAGVALDKANNIYITEWGGRVRKIDSLGVINTIAGTGTGGTIGDYRDGVPATAAALEPEGIIIDSTYDIYVVDIRSGRVRYITNTLAVNTVNDANKIAIYPNPSKGELTVTASYKINEVVITNLLGQTVYIHNYNAMPVQINVSKLSAGIYLIKINGSEIRKFTKL